jgi:hypothetical protein
MELSDKDKGLILDTKRNIRQITSEISSLISDIHKNRDEILDKMSHITGYISDLCAITNNSNCDPDLQDFRKDYWIIQSLFDSQG